MNRIVSEVEAQVAILDRSLRRTRWVVFVAGLVILALVGILYAQRPPTVLDEVRTRRLVVVDDVGRARVAISQDPRESQRRSRSVGLTVFDSTGMERGGFVTLDDGSVLIGMDAPSGVGNPMGERLTLLVDAKGAAGVMLLDNLTRAVARLQSDGDGGGGVQVFKWDMERRSVHVRTIIYDGDRHEVMPLD